MSENYKKFKELLEKSLVGGLIDVDKFIKSFLEPINLKSEGIKDGWKSSTYVSDDGSYRITTYVLDTSSKENNDISNLENELKKCIDNQNYEQAAIIRDKIKAIKNNDSKILKLNKELEDAIKEQNFERAIEIRDELKKIN